MAEGSLSIFAVLLNDLKTMQVPPNNGLELTGPKGHTSWKVEEPGLRGFGPAAHPRR